MAKLIYSHSTALSPYVLNRFADLVGPSELNRVLKRVRHKLGCRRVVNPAVLSRYQIPLGLAALYERNVIALRHLRLSDEPHLYEALSFAAGAVEFSRHMSLKAQKALRGRVIDSLKPDRDARPLAHEFRVAFSLAQRDWDISFDDFEQRSRHDFTARREDKEIEIECKMMSGDTGNSVHRDDFDIFANKLIAGIGRMAPNIPPTCIDIELVDRLPVGEIAIKEIISAVKSILNGSICIATSDRIKIAARHLDLAQYGANSSDLLASGATVLRHIQREKNGSVFGIFSKSQLIVVHVFSMRKPRVQVSVRSQIEDASSQLSKCRPGVIWSHFADLESSELDELIALYNGGNITLLQGIAYKMFSKPGHDHVAASFFSGEGSVRMFGGRNSFVIHPAFYSQQGTLYPLWNANCALNQPFVELI